MGALLMALTPHAQAQADALSLDAAMALAVERSQAVQAARAGTAAAQAGAHAAGELPDPMLRVGIENLPVTGPDRLSLNRDGQTMKRIGLSQEWVSADKRAARQAAARALTTREQLMQPVATAEARLQTALAYIDSWFAGQALLLTELGEHHAHETLAAGQARLASPNGLSTAEVLALQAALGQAADETNDVRQQQGAATAALQRWVGRPVPVLLEPPPGTPPDETDFVDRHPVVVARLQDLQVARQEAAVVASNRQPNWTWELAYGQRSGAGDMVSVVMSLPLPVAPAARQDRETAARLALVDKAEAELAEARRMAQGEHAALLSDLRRLQQRIGQLQQAVLQPTRQRIDATLAAYRSNQASLSMLFEARHAEVEVRRKLLALQRDLARTQAQLSFKPLAAGAQP